jgi:hypothetical protein
MPTPFNGQCLINSAGINGIDGLVHISLKDVNGTFDWKPFTAKPEQAREMLAIALAAITSNKNVGMQTQDVTTPWAPVWWLDIIK